MRGRTTIMAQVVDGELWGTFLRGPTVVAQGRESYRKMAFLIQGSGSFFEENEQDVRPRTCPSDQLRSVPTITITKMTRGQLESKETWKRL